VYLGGTTYSSSGITTLGGWQTVFGGNDRDMFLVRFNASGVRQWATYWGGNSVDDFNALGCDALGNIVLVGYTASSGMGTTGVWQPSFDGFSTYNPCVIKFASTGSRTWATYYQGGGAGTPDFTSFGSVAFDPFDNSDYVGGYTPSITGIATAATHQSTYQAGSYNGMLVKFNQNGGRVWATYYGGGNSAGYAPSVVVNSLGHVFIASITSSATGQTQAVSGGSVHQSTYGGSNDAYLARMNGSNGIRIWATYYGGFSSFELAYGI
jgi:hypothetical protein